MIGNNKLLQREIVKFVHTRSSTSRGDLVGEIAKSPSRRDSNPDWMKIKSFNGSSWLDLEIHERKYILRKTVPVMIDRGVLILETYRSVIRNQDRYRLKVGSLLDMIAAVSD